MTTLHKAAQQALEALEAFLSDELRPYEAAKTAANIRAALAQEQAERVQEPDLSRCPQCNGPADNGHDRSIPPNPYLCTRCMAEPPQRKPLTEEEIYKMYNEFWRSTEAVDFARAIERAHGIGEQP